MLKNKKLLLIAGLAVVILVSALILTFVSWKKIPASTNNQPAPSAAVLRKPEFMTSAEKVHFKLQDNVKAQVLNRDASGTPTVYKLINTDYDVIADPSKVAPISPRQQSDSVKK